MGQKVVKIINFLFGKVAHTVSKEVFVISNRSELKLVGNWEALAASLQTYVLINIYIS